MKKFKLKNGLTVLWEQRDTPVVSIEVSVGTGSNNEKPAIAGISHFLEHMMFEGTAKRTAKQISETIENVGGELNAATTNERTFYYIKIPANKGMLGMEILSDMMQNPAFDLKQLDKERKVILEEIKMTDDQPLHYQWILFEKMLYKKHPTKNPVYGRTDSVKAITRSDMYEYYKKWYVPANMTLAIVGNMKDAKRLSEKYFGSIEQGKFPEVKNVREPKDKKNIIKTEKRDVNQTYMILGNKTVPRNHKDSFALDVIEAVFSKGMSGRINEEIRLKRGLAYAVGAHHESKKDYGFFCFYVNCANENNALCKRLILEEIKKLANLGTEELNAAKEHIVGDQLLDMEDSQKRADELTFWEFIKDYKMADAYLKQIKKVTLADVKRVRNKYFDGNYTQVMLRK